MAKTPRSSAQTLVTSLSRKWIVPKIVILSPYLKKKSLFSVKASDQEDRMVREVKIALEGDTDLIINEKVECIIHVK